MSRSNARNTTRLHFLWVLGVILALTSFVIAFLRMDAHPVNNVDLVVDPTAPYPYENIPGLANSPKMSIDYLFEVIPFWLIILIVISTALIVMPILLISTQTVHIMGATALTIIVPGVAFYIAFPSVLDTTDTFSTWAKERYGIEMETYPSHSYGVFSNDGDPDLRRPITLDNGDVIIMRGIIDARSNKALVLAPYVDRANDTAELEVIAE